MALLTNRTMSLLKSEHVHCEVIHHKIDYTALETAQDTHTPGSDFAKTVVIATADGYACVVLPAIRQLDFGKAQSHFHEPARLATEQELARLFPDCEVGAEPPFGNLYDLPVYVTPELASHEVITFNAGTHHEAVRMRYEDFKRLVKPAMVELAQ